VECHVYYRGSCCLVLADRGRAEPQLRYMGLSPQVPQRVKAASSLVEPTKLGRCTRVPPHEGMIFLFFLSLGCRQQYHSSGFFQATGEKKIKIWESRLKRRIACA